jgi:hypothetical protein
MRNEICVIFLFILITNAAHVKDDEEIYGSDDDDKMDENEIYFFKNLTSILREAEGRGKDQSRKKNPIKDMLTKKPQIPPVNGDPVQTVTSRLPCECKNGICSCCINGFFFSNKGCMKIRYIPEDFAFELRMMFNQRTLYKNTISGKNPRPICISPPRFDNWIEMCAKFHDIYFVGRNMHLCLDVSASLGEFDIVDR